MSGRVELAAQELVDRHGEGKGVHQNYKTALKWYRLAAEQGFAGHQNNLGAMYEVLQDYVRAHMWYNLAASSGEVRKHL
jgi:hypothetical protein